MKKTALALSLLITFGLYAQKKHTASGPTIQTASGALRGSTEGGITTFK